MNLIEGLKLLNEILPKASLGFALSVLLQSGVRSIIFKDGEEAWAMTIFGIPGACDIEKKEIELDMGMKKEELAKIISRRHGIPVEPLEVGLWVILHEAGHILKGESQEAAERFAREKFLQWKKESQQKNL